MSGKVQDEPDAAAPFGARPAGLPARLAWSLATSPRLSSSFRRQVRKRFARRFPGPFDVVASGVKLRAYPAENRCDRVAVGQGALPEAAERDLIAPLIKPEMVFVDIGANIGLYSLHISQKTGGAARVVAFEPNPRNHAKLTFNCTVNGFSNVTCINAAVGPDDGEATLYFDGGGNAGGASMREGAQAAKVAIPVKMQALAGCLDQLSIAFIDLLKIDVEGFEDEALMPFFSAAPRSLWPAHLLLEMVHASSWKQDLPAFLLENGYRRSGETAENSLFTKG